MPKPSPKKRPAETGSTVISLRLPTARLSELDAMAERTGMARTSLIQLAIERLLKQGL